MAHPTEGQFGSSIVRELSCPYCAAEYRAEWLKARPGYGTLHCECGASPVIEGIPWLARGRFGIGSREDLTMDSAVASIQRGDAESALCEALLWSSRSRARRVAALFKRLGRPAPAFLLRVARRRLREAVLGDTQLTYSKALAELRNSRYADYLYHRFANPSLLAAIPVMLLLRELAQRRGTPARVLEVGGGTGHASFLIRRYFPDLNVVLTDSDFTNLYLARRFIAPTCESICVDAEARLPFADHSIDAVFCQDAFHYMREKADLVQELRRVVKPGGTWLFPHLHNAAAANPAPGIPLAPTGYARLFSFLNPRLFSEANLLRQFHSDQTVDLRQAPPVGELRDSQAVTLVAGPESLWQRHDFRSLFMRPAPDLQINRIYQRSATGVPGPIHWPNGDLKAECGEIEAFLQRRPEVSADAMDRLKRGEETEIDSEAIGTLIRDFALVPMPEHYD